MFRPARISPTGIAVAAAMTLACVTAMASGLESHASEAKATSKAAAPKEEMREIFFPVKVPLGNLEFMKMDTRGLAPKDGGIKIPAKGKVKVPKNAGMQLSMSYEGSIIMSNLDSLHPDDLQGMDFTMTAIDNDSLKHIEHLTGLKRLVLRDTDITDPALVHLKPLTNLVCLGMTKTDISDEGLKNVSGLTNLRELNIGRNNLNGSGLKYLKRLNKLKRLDLGVTRVTGDKLVAVEHLPIEVLRLEESKMNDEGCKYVNHFQSLKFLDLNHDAITDQGLANLGRMPDLEKLEVKFTKVTIAGINAFLKLNKQCTIEAGDKDKMSDLRKTILDLSTKYGIVRDMDKNKKKK